MADADEPYSLVDREGRGQLTRYPTVIEAIEAMRPTATRRAMAVVFVPASTGETLCLWLYPGGDVKVIGIHAAGQDVMDDDPSWDSEGG